MPTWGENGTRGQRIKEQAPKAGYIAGAAAIGAGAAHTRGARAMQYGSKPWNRKVGRAGALAGMGAAAVGATAGRHGIRNIYRDFKPKKEKREQPTSRIDFSAPGKVQSVRTKNFSVGASGALSQKDEAAAQAGDWSEMEAKARAALDRQKRKSMTAADRRNA